MGHLCPDYRRQERCREWTRKNNTHNSGMLKPLCSCSVNHVPVNLTFFHIRDITYPILSSDLEPISKKSKCPGLRYATAKNAHILPVCSAFWPLQALTWTLILFLRWALVKNSSILFQRALRTLRCQQLLNVGTCIANSPTLSILISTTYWPGYLKARTAEGCCFVYVFILGCTS